MSDTAKAGIQSVIWPLNMFSTLLAMGTVDIVCFDFGKGHLHSFWILLIVTFRNADGVSFDPGLIRICAVSE